MKYTVELMSSVYITVPVEAGSLEEAEEKALESLPRYPVAAVKADQYPGQMTNPIDPGNIRVAKDWEVISVEKDTT